MFRAGGRGRPCLAAPAVPIGRCWTQRTGKARARLPIPRGSTSAARNPNTPASRTPKAKGEEEYIVPCSPTLSNAPEPSWRLPAAGIVKQSLEGMRRRMRNNGFRNECRRVVRFFSAGRSLPQRRPASVPRRLRPKLFTTHFLAKRSPGPAAGGAPVGASRPRAQGLPYQKEKEPAIIVMLSEAKHLFWARLQILRRSAPQNDKLLNCSQTPQQTGICNWRQHGKVKEKMFETAATCRDKHRLQPCEPKPRPA